MNGSLPQLGRRGEGWVALQLVLLVAIAAAGSRGSRWPSPARSVRMAGAAVSALGGPTSSSAASQSASASRSRHSRSRSRTAASSASGAYDLVRHPMYGGVLLLALAWSLISSPLALAPWSVAAVFLDAKRRREEAWLVEAHPDYEEYRASVRHSFVPFVW